jgi:sporulation protein YlmC with PRC-barrel domain
MRAPWPGLADKKDITMKSLSLFLATTSLAATLGFAAPVLAETVQKVMLTQVDPTVLTTAWRASDILGTMIYDDNGVEIGKVKDLLVVAGGAIPFVIITNIPGDDETARNVVVSASDFELVDKKLTMHGGSAAVLLGAPIF